VPSLSGFPLDSGAGSGKGPPRDKSGTYSVATVSNCRNCAKVVPEFPPDNVPVATISKHGKGWRVQIRRLGHKPLSKTFPLKASAWAWAAKTERDLLEGRSVEESRHTVEDALIRYAEHVSPKKRGQRWEELRIGVFRRSTIAHKPLSRLSSADLAAWRDQRLKSVSGASVRRDMNLWESILETARKEWKWIAVNPIRDVKKPPSPKSRQRGVSEAEIKAMDEALVGPQSREVFLGFLLGIESAMRAGEMWSLTRDQINFPIVKLSKTKNGDSREVPLSPKAIEIVKSLLADGREALFTVSPASRDALFRKARKKTWITDLHFHDSRSEGISRLSKKMDVLELARVVGHRDLKSLLIYYKADAKDIARRLAG
jgi:integrase